MRNSRAGMSMSRFYYHRDQEDSLHPRQVMIDEVLYLHSLWNQGPPAERHRSERISPVRREGKRKGFEPATKPSSKATAKKKPLKKAGKRKKQRQEPKDSEEGKTPADAPGDEKWKGEWNAGSQAMDAEWNSTPRKAVDSKPLSQEEELQLGQIKLQQKLLRTVKEFFNRGEDANSTEDDDDDDDDDDEEEEDEEEERGEDGDGNEGAAGQRSVGKELEALNFFLKLFEDEKELAKYYEQSCNCGAFECLVCAGVGAKIGKRFPDCVSLIQHSMKILKTKKKAAHRGYGSAICRLLGWNPERLPSVVKPNDLKPRGCIPPADELDEPGQEVDPVGEAAISKEAPGDAGGDAEEATEDDEGDADEASADDEVDADEGTEKVEDAGQASD